MLFIKDTFKSGWLAAIRPIPFFLLLIGECTAQEVYTDLVGMKRVYVQMKMKKESFIDYQKSHVTYRLSPEVKQTLLYEADTCKAFYWSVALDSASSFETKLQAAGLKTSDYRKTENGTETKSHVIFLVDSKLESGEAVADRKQSGKSKKKRMAGTKNSSTGAGTALRASQLPPKEERPQTDWDTVNKVSVFGWELED